MGQHIKAGACSVLTCSRDALAQPLEELRRVVLKVRSGAFRPDETRSGRWYSEDTRLPAGLSQPTWEWVDADALDASGGTVAPEEADSDSEHTPGHGDGGSEQSSDGEAERAAQGLGYEVSSDDAETVRAGRRPSGHASRVVWRHVKRGTFHSGHADSPLKLACGRAVEIGRYEMVESVPRLMWPRCVQCFGGAAHGDTAPAPGSWAARASSR